ncbi:hypothetical protein PO28_17530, partial [Vibrio anguillarum]
MPSIPKPTSLERIDSTSNLASSGTTIHPHVKVISVQHVNKPKSNSQTKNRSEKILKKLDSEIENSKGNTNNERKHKEDLQRIKYWVERAQVGEVSDESHYEEVFINEVDRCLGQGRKTYIEQKARELILQIKAYDVEGGIRPNRLNTSAGGVALRILSVFSGHLFPEPMVLDSARNGSVSTSPSLPFGGQPRIQPSPQNAMKMKTIKVESSVSPVEQDVNVVASRQNSSPALGKSTAAPLSGYKYGKEIATHLMATENNMHGHQGNLELIKETLENYTENLMTFEGGEIVENTEVREKIQNLFSSISIEDIEELENQAVETAIDEDTDDESVIDSHTRQKRSLPSGRKRKDYGGIEEHFVKRINEKMERKDISIHRKRIFVKKKLAQIKINVLRLNTLQEKGIKVSKPRIIHLNFKQKFLQSKLDQLVAFKKSKSTFSNLLDLWNGELDKNALNELSTELSELRANFINQLSILSVSSTDRENDPLPFNNAILVLNENIAILSNLLQLVSKLPYFNDAKSLKILNERSIEWQSLDNNFRKLIKKISKSGIDSINTTSAIRKLKSLNYFIDEQIQETKNYVNTCTDALFVGWLGEKNRQGATPLYFNRESLYRDIIEFKSKMAVQDSIDERTRNSLEIESLVMKSLPSTELTEVELSNTAAALYLTSRIYDIKKTDPHAVENIDIDKFIFSDLIYGFSDHLGRIKYDVISVVDYLCSEATNHPILKRKQVSVSWPSEVHDNLLIFLNEEKVNVTKFLRFMEKQSSVEANKDKLLSSIETPMSYFQHTLDRLAVNEPGVELSNTVTYRYTVFSHHPEAHSVAMRENPPVKKSFSIADILTGRERAWRAENTAYNEREIINTSGISNSLIHSLENTDTQAEFLRSMNALRSDLQVKERFYDYAKSALELHQLDINHSYSIREAPMLLIYPSPEDGPHFSKKWSYDLNPEYSPIKLFSLLTNKVLIFASINDFKRQIRVNTELREWVQLHFPAEFHGNYDQMTIDKKGMDYSNLFERTMALLLK